MMKASETPIVEAPVNPYNDLASKVFSRIKTPECRQAFGECFSGKAMLPRFCIKEMELTTNNGKLTMVRVPDPNMLLRFTAQIPRHFKTTVLKGVKVFYNDGSSEDYPLEVEHIIGQETESENSQTFSLGLAM